MGRSDGFRPVIGGVHPGTAGFPLRHRIAACMRGCKGVTPGIATVYQSLAISLTADSREFVTDMNSPLRATTRGLSSHRNVHTLVLHCFKP